MKRREGYVSNSSCTSFIISCSRKDGKTGFTYKDYFNELIEMNPTLIDILKTDDYNKISVLPVETEIPGLECDYDEKPRNEVAEFLYRVDWKERNTQNFEINYKENMY